jgi:CDP-6-deoxy-D-xylo-4-hexulose-3-dehydrase
MNTQEKPAAAIRVPYGFSVHGQEEIDAVVEVLKGNTALGDKTDEFERRIADLFGKKYGVMVNSGSSANLLAFEILDLPKGSEVITPLLTFATTVAPIVQKGLVPVFVDVEPNTFLADLDQVEAAIGEKTRALMIPSLMGNIPNLQRLADLAKKHNLWLIEDSCDTLGGRFAGRPTGEFSHITTSSFYGSHIINGAGGGGIICVNDEAWRERLVVLRGWGRQSSLFGEKAKSELIENRFETELSGIPYDNKFVFSELGYNFLPLEISSAFALVQLRKFPKFAAARKANYENLHRFFERYPEFFALAAQTPKTDTVWLAFPLILNEDAPFTRLELVTFLENANIQTRPVFTGNILKQPGFESIPHRAAQTSYPNAEHVMRNALVVGAHHGLEERQIDYLKEKVEEFLGRYR